MNTDSPMTAPPAADNAPPATTAAQERQQLRGIFSIQEIRKVGTGTTQRKTIQKTY